MADELANKSTPPIPPRLDLKKMGIITPPAGAPQAAPNSAAAPAMPKSGITFTPVTPAVSANIAAAAKKETSRIPLNLAKPAPAPALAGGLGTGETTIRVKPTASAITISTPTAMGTTSPETAAKRTTSRISLDAVLGAESASEGLKTIKLKRPGDTIKVNAPAASAPAPVMAPPAVPPIPEPEIEAPTEAEEPAAGRKTIKLKRDTMAKPAGPAFNISRSQNLNASPVMDDSEGKVFFIFPICSLLAIVATVLVIVMFMSQLYAGVSWPGKLTF